MAPSWPQEVWGLSNVECSDINDPMVGKILKKKNTTNFSIISLTYSHTLWVEINECRGLEEQTCQANEKIFQQGDWNMLL